MVVKRQARLVARGVLPAATGLDRLVSDQRIVAVGLLTQQELNLLGPAFERAFPVDGAPCFSELLRAIDESDRQLWRDRDKKACDQR